MRNWTLSAAFVALVVLVLALTGCAADTGDGDGDETKGPVTVGSKIDTEGSVLAQVIIQMLQDNGFEVVDRSSLGTTDVNREALEAGEIDVYPEYTGTAINLFFPEAGIDPAISKDADESYSTVKELDADNGFSWLAASPANNTWAVAIPRGLSEAESIVTWEDFADYVNGDGEVKLVGSQEFVERDDALKAFEAEYGFELTDDQLIVLAGGNTSQSEKAAAEGTNGANAAMAYGTDGSLAALDLVVLEDTAGVQPIYQPAPVFRSEVLDDYPEIADILDPVFEALDLETLQDLNGRVAVDGEDPADVVQEFLTDGGFLG